MYENLYSLTNYSLHKINKQINNKTRLILKWPKKSTFTYKLPLYLFLKWCKAYLYQLNKLFL